MKSLILAFIFLFSFSAFATEVSLGGGHNFVTNDYSSGLGDDINTKSAGGLALQAQFLMDSGIENVQWGLEVGYLKYSHAEYNGGSFPAYNRDEANIPILAVGRYYFVKNLYGDAKAGLTLDKISTTLGSPDSGNTTPYVALGLDVGYSVMLTNELSIDPRVNFYAFFISGPYTQIAPTISLAYRL